MLFRVAHLVYDEERGVPHLAYASAPGVFIL
jgi:hypothetical protein